MNERRTGILLPRVNRRESALTLFERGDRGGGVGGYGGFQWEYNERVSPPLLKGAGGMKKEEESEGVEEGGTYPQPL